MPFSFEVKGAERLANGLTKAARDTLPNELYNAIGLACLYVESGARRRVKRDTGRLQNSITHTIEKRGSDIVGRVGPSVRYGLYVERGRRPGRPPPVSALAPWARRHGVSPYVVARAIGRRGVRAAPFLLPAYEAARGEILLLFRRVGIKAVETMAGR